MGLRCRPEARAKFLPSSFACAAAGPEIDHLAADLRQWFHDWAADGLFQALHLPD